MNSPTSSPTFFSTTPFLTSLLLSLLMVPAVVGLTGCENMQVKTADSRDSGSVSGSSGSSVKNQSQKIQSEDIDVSGSGLAKIEKASMSGTAVAAAEPPATATTAGGAKTVVAAPTDAGGSAGSASGLREAGGVLMAVEMTGETSWLPSGGCRLKLQNIRTQKDIFVSLKKDVPAIYKELEPGRYFGTRLSCSLTRIWNLDGIFGFGFDVVPGKVSYIGKVIFEFTKDDLAGYRQAPRLDSQKALLDAQAVAPWELRHSLVGGYTLKTMTPAAIESDGPEAFDVYAKGTPSPDQTLADLMSRLKLCSANGAKDDPLRFGHLTYVALYKSGQFSSMKEKIEAHALGDSLVTCIDNSLRTFRPPVQNELEVRVRY